MSVIFEFILKFIVNFFMLLYLLVTILEVFNFYLDLEILLLEIELGYFDSGQIPTQDANSNNSDAEYEVFLYKEATILFIKKK